MSKPSRCVWRLLVLTAVAQFAVPVHAENWPCWRGPRNDGSSLEEGIPIRWNGTAGENIAWKVAIPGVGHASPIVWEDRIFQVTCDEETEDRLLLCLDRNTGKTLWRRTVVNSPLEKKHGLNSRATSTPATDGELVYVSFLDRTEMLVAAYDFSGKRQWLVRPGEFFQPARLLQFRKRCSRTW